ncbi:MAG: aldo/keto reductase, partial [Bacillota bacterium]
RFAGFSAHTEKAALALIESYDFETVLFPVNFNCWLNRGMGKQVLVEAEERNMGRMAIKALAKRSWYEDEEQGKTWYKPITDNYKLARAALKFTLSQSVHLAMSPGAPELIRMGLDLVEDIDDFSLTEEEEVLLQKKAEEYEPIFTGDN